LFITIQIALDLSLGMFVLAGFKLAAGIFGVVVLDALCGVNLGIVSWAIIVTPFIVTALATSIALGLDLDRMVLLAAKEHFVDGMHNKKAPVKRVKKVSLGSKKSESFTDMPSELEERGGSEAATLSGEVDYPFSTMTPF
jgi:hypothetical protein